MKFQGAKGDQSLKIFCRKLFTEGLLERRVQWVCGAAHMTHTCGGPNIPSCWGRTVSVPEARVCCGHKSRNRNTQGASLKRCMKAAWRVVRWGTPWKGTISSPSWPVALAASLQWPPPTPSQAVQPPRQGSSPCREGMLVNHRLGAEGEVRRVCSGGLVTGAGKCVTVWHSVTV